MSESRLPPDLVVWSRDARMPAVPGRAPAGRHQPLGGLAGVDWRLRHGLARRGEEAFLAAAGASSPVPDNGPASRPGDLTLACVRRALAASLAAAGEAAAGVTSSQVLGLLRGCYLVLPAARRLPAVAVAAAVAARCGLGVHLACAEKDAVAAMLEAVRAALGEAAPATALAESAQDRPLVAAVAPGVLIGTAAAFAHAWLRWGGERDALARAAAVLAGDSGAVFSFAPLLLTADGEQVLLDMVRHPLQLTSDRPEDASLFMLQLARMVETWEAGEAAGEALTPTGEAALAAAAQRHGGLWAVPALRRAYAQALLRARACVPEQDFVMESGRLRWLIDPVAKVTEPAEVPALELALRCLQGQPPVQRVRRRAWFTDFFAGYARLGAAGENLAGEAADLWWLHGLPVLGNGPRRLRVEWSPYTLAALAADPEVPVGLGSRRLAGLPGLPPEAPCLDSREGQRALAAALGEGRRVQVLGVVAAPRQLPPGVSSIILAADDPTVPPLWAALAQRLLRLGGPGRLLARGLGAWVLARAGAEREALRRALVLRGQQERRTYAFSSPDSSSRATTGEAS